MASLSRDKKRNGYRIQFYTGQPKRKRSIWLGDKLFKGCKRPDAEAGKIRDHVEHLIGIKEHGGQMGKLTAAWLETVSRDSREVRDKLVKVELLEPLADEREPVTLAPFLAEYVTFRRDVKESTRIQYRQVIKSLVDFFGSESKLNTISNADAERWRIHVRTLGNRRDEDLEGWADNTIRRTTGRARQFFSHAVKLKLITENPFDGFPVAVHGNTKRQQFVTHETIRQALDACSCPEFRAVIALSRFGGLRVPSEVARIAWMDVDLEVSRLTVRAPKTEHHEDGGLRFVPIFPELRPYLQELHDKVQPGLNCPMSNPVISRWTSGTQNLRTEFLRVLTLAGIKQWPKLFQNLRASRQTELLAEFPTKDVCDWLGNTQAVAMRHYAMATSESFDRAVKRNREQGSCSTGCSIPTDQEPSEEPDPPANTLKNVEIMSGDALGHEQKLPGQDSNWCRETYGKRY
jgi:integrase